MPGQCTAGTQGLARRSVGVRAGTHPRDLLVRAIICLALLPLCCVLPLVLTHLFLRYHRRDTPLTPRSPCRVGPCLQLVSCLETAGQLRGRASSAGV